jgi:MFS family permease
MTALLQLGAFIGAALSGFFADRYSRKASIGETHIASFYTIAVLTLTAVGIVVGALGS